MLHHQRAQPKQVDVTLRTCQKLNYLFINIRSAKDNIKKLPHIQTSYVSYLQVVI
jgi:hypothetical protein